MLEKLFTVRDLLLQMSDAADEATFLEATEPLGAIIEYIGASSLHRFSKKQELIDALVLHIVYTRKKTVFTQYVHDIKGIPTHELTDMQSVSRRVF